MASVGKSGDLEKELDRSFLTLEEIDINIFRSPSENLWQPFRSRFIFGGQVVGQALVAACNTVPASHQVHSLHCYFLRGGNSKKPIVYHVDRTRDGATYVSRSIKATQDGLSIFTMQASFKTDENHLYQHQMKMPQVPGPEELSDAAEILKEHLETEKLTDQEKTFWNRTLAEEVPMQIRPLDPSVFYRFKPGEPTRLLWMRAVGYMGEDHKLHQCMAAYMSDNSLLGTSLQPGGPNFITTFMTSLDHTVWFHNTFRADEWLLYETFSPQCGKGRALCLGRLWRRDGVLAMSVAQEGVVRTVPRSKV